VSQAGESIDQPAGQARNSLVDHIQPDALDPGEPDGDVRDGEEVEHSKRAPARTSATRWGALTARQRSCAASISLNAMAIPAALEPGPVVTLSGT